MKIKLFATDIDGTLCFHESQTTEENVKALRELTQSGVEIVFATGRVASSPKTLLRQLGLRGYVLGCNGAVTLDKEGTVLDIIAIEKDIQKTLRKICNRDGYYYHLYDEETYYSEQLWMNRLYHIGDRIPEQGYRPHVKINISPDPVEEARSLGKSVVKFQIKLTDDQKVNLLSELESLGCMEKIYATSSGYHMIEIGDARIDKWKGICRLAERIGISPDGIAAIGDEKNDIPMVRGAALGFAIANAIDEVKEVADITTKATSEESGVAEAAREILRRNAMEQVR